MAKWLNDDWMIKTKWQYDNDYMTKWINYKVNLWINK